MGLYNDRLIPIDSHKNAIVDSNSAGLDALSQRLWHCLATKAQLSMSPRVGLFVVSKVSVLSFFALTFSCLKLRPAALQKTGSGLGFEDRLTHFATVKSSAFFLMSANEGQSTVHWNLGSLDSGSQCLPGNIVKVKKTDQIVPGVCCDGVAYGGHMGCILINKEIGHVLQMEDCSIYWHRLPWLVCAGLSCYQDMHGLRRILMRRISRAPCWARWLGTIVNRWPIVALTFILTTLFSSVACTTTTVMSPSLENQR